MEVINNQNKLIGDDLKTELKNGSKLKITASCFSIYAFDALKEELKDIEELKFIFSSPTFIEDKISDKIKKESREFYIPHEIRESTLYGTPFEIKLRNKLTQKAIAKKLSDNWNRYIGNKKTNIFYKDKIRYDVFYHTDLGRKSGKSNGQALEEIYWENYDLIVIDESHNFRNNNHYKDKETRYQFLMDKVMKPGVKTKVLMLSATPVNNKFKDLQNQLALTYCDNLEEFENKLDTEQSVRQIFLKAQRVFDEWIKIPSEERKAKDLIDNLDMDFSILLDSVTIARSRKHIVKYYDTKDIGSFPKRLKAKSYYCDLTKRHDVIGYDDIYSKIANMTLAIYAPMSYIFTSKFEK